MKLFVVFLLTTSLSLPVFALPDNEDFSIIPGFPQPAPGSFGVVGTSTPSGQFLIWNGADVFRQQIPGEDTLDLIASGYLGDPGFITLNPAGDMALLGEGFGDGVNANVYVIDLNAPNDFMSGDEIVIENHFSGVFLNSSLVALDRGDFGVPAEIIVLDLFPGTRSLGVEVTVLQIPEPQEGRTTVVTKPEDSFSASLAVNDGLLYVADAGNGQYKTFPVADVITAFNTATSIPWVSGADIGTPFQYPLGGVSGFTATGNLVIAGFGTIVEVDPSTGTVVKALDPAGTAPFYGIIYNAASEEIIAVEFPATFGDPLVFHASRGGFSRPPSGGSCLIATAAYGTPLAEEIDVLRTLRDRHFLRHALGTALADSYYRMSPPFADRIASDQVLKRLTRLLLRPVVWAARSGITTLWALFAIGSIIFLNQIRFKRRRKGAWALNAKHKRR